MRRPRFVKPLIAVAALGSLYAAYAYAMGSATRVAISGTVSDFDEHYLVLDSRSERYRIKRSGVPSSIELRPGAFVDFEISLSDLRVVPATAPATVPYKAPRKRTPAEQ